MMKKSEQRGFTLLIVVLVLAMVALVGMIVVDVLNIEARLVGARRLSQEAQQVAEGALGEVIEDRTLVSILPNPTESSLTADYVPSSQTVFSGPSSDTQPGRSFEAKISMVRAVPVHESSLNVLRAFMYEVAVESKINSGEATDSAQSAVYKLFSHESGTVLPEVHAR